MTRHRLIFLGLSLSSSWGNGHATTYRALLRGLADRGERALFLERDVPWYADNRDLAEPEFCDLAFYGSLADLERRFLPTIRAADAVIVGSFVPDGIAVLDLVLGSARGRIAFYDIDTPITAARLSGPGCEYIARRQIPALDLYLSFSGGAMVTRLERSFGARTAATFHCCVDDTLYRPTGGPVRWDLGYIGTYSPDRQPALERLLIEPARQLPDHRFVVAGPQYPADIRWPPNVRYLSHLAPADHAGFYSGLRFALNLTRADMVAAGWSPSVRIFEAAACGTPIISDRWRGLGDLLPEGEAVLVADDTDDIVAALTATDNEARRRIGAAARKRILACHTGRKRAGDLLELLALSRQRHGAIEARGTGAVIAPS